MAFFESSEATMSESEALARKYRPTQFSEIVGNRMNAIVLDNMVQAGQVPNGLLFSGPSGVGKTSAARILARELKATDVIEVDAASTGGVEAIRDLLDVTRYSTGGGYRIIILDEAQSITRQGFEALLKTLEEPPADTIFVLCSTAPHKIPDMILSRLIEFEFRSVSENDILSRLIFIASEEIIPADDDLLRHLAQRAQGNVRKAVQMLDQCRRSDTFTLLGFLELTGEHDTIPLLMAALATGEHDKVFEALDRQLAVSSPSKITADLIACVIDMLVIKAGGEPRVTGTPRERRVRIAERLDRENLLLAVKILWDSQTALRSSEDPRGTLELSLVLIAGALSRGRSQNVRMGAEVTPTPVGAARDAAPSAHRKLTLAEMQQRKDGA